MPSQVKAGQLIRGKKTNQGMNMLAAATTLGSEVRRRIMGTPKAA